MCTWSGDQSHEGGGDILGVGTNRTGADDYNRQVKCGIVGVHQQALYLIAMRQEFRERFKDSPIHFQEYILSLSGPVEVVDGKMIIRGLPS